MGTRKGTLGCFQRSRRLTKSSAPKGESKPAAGGGGHRFVMPSSQCSSSEQSSSHGTQHTHATQLHSGQQLDGEPTLIVRAARDELMMTRKNTAAKGSRTCRVLQHRARHVPLFFFFWRTVQPMVRVPVCCLHVPAETVLFILFMWVSYTC